MSALPKRPAIRRVRAGFFPRWTPGTTMPPPRGTLDDASDLVPTVVARPEPTEIETMVKTQSGIHELPPSVGGIETMEIFDVDLEPVPKQSDIRELAPGRRASRTEDELSSLVHAFEERALRPASPVTEEIDLANVEEVVLKRSAPPPLPKPAAKSIPKVRAPRAPITPAIKKAVTRAARIYAFQVLALIDRWRELYDLDTRTKVAVVVVWMAFWANLTLLVR